jgi:hypothetical protein
MKIFKLLLFIVWIVSSMMFVVMPCALGYWYMASGAKSFMIPWQYWILPSVYIAVAPLTLKLLLED